MHATEQKSRCPKVVPTNLQVWLPVIGLLRACGGELYPQWYSFRDLRDRHTLLGSIPGFYREQQLPLGTISSVYSKAA